jgi:hypothetical protein
MLTLYCDDSGTHPKSSVAVAACFIASVDQWDRLKMNWEKINEDENFGVFHMADFVAKHEQFAAPEWQDQEKRDRTIKKLINIIQTRVQFAVCCSVDKSAYDEVRQQNLHHPFWQSRKNHYSFAVRHCLANIQKWREQYKHTDPMRYVFDRLSKGKGEIDAQMEIAAGGLDDGCRQYGISKDGWGYDDKSVVTQLQAADIWAWENYKYMVDCFLPETSEKKQVRKSYGELLKIPRIVRYHNRKTLLELARRTTKESL